MLIYPVLNSLERSWSPGNDSNLIQETREDFRAIQSTGAIDRYLKELANSGQINPSHSPTLDIELQISNDGVSIKVDNLQWHKIESSDPLENEEILSRAKLMMQTARTSNTLGTSYLSQHDINDEYLSDTPSTRVNDFSHSPDHSNSSKSDEREAGIRPKNCLARSTSSSQSRSPTSSPEIEVTLENETYYDRLLGNQRAVTFLRPSPDQLQEEYKEKEREISHLARELSVHRSNSVTTETHADAMGRIKELEEERDQLHRQLEQSIQSQRIELEEIHERIERLQKERDQAEVAAKTDQQGREHLRNELHSTLRENDKLKRELREHDKGKELLLGELAQSRSRADRLTETIAERDSTIEELQTSNKAQLEELRSAKADRARVQIRLDETSEQFRHLQQFIFEREAAIEDHFAQKTRLFSEYTNIALTDLQAIIDDKEETIERISGEYIDRADENMDLRLQINKLKQKTSDQATTIRESRRDLDRTAQERDQAHIASKDLKELSEALQRSILKHENTISQLMRTIYSISDEKQELNTLLAHRTKEYETLQARSRAAALEARVEDRIADTPDRFTAPMDEGSAVAADLLRLQTRFVGAAADHQNAFLDLCPTIEVLQSQARELEEGVRRSGSDQFQFKAIDSLDQQRLLTYIQDLKEVLK